MKELRLKALKEELNKCVDEQEIHTAITNALMKEGEIVGDCNEDAVKYFESFDMFGEVKHNTIINQTYDLSETIDDKEVMYGVRVVITEHYIDSGSDDYLYTYDVTPPMCVCSSAV